MTVRRSLFILTVLTLILPVMASLVIATQEEAVRQEKQNNLETLQTHIVQRDSLFITVPAVGNIQAEEIANLSLLTGGRVAEILVDEGDYVTSGTALIRLKNDTQRINYERANLNYEVAVRQQQELITPDEDAIALAEANVASARGAYNTIASAITNQDIEAAELRYQQALTAAQAAEKARREASSSLTDEAITLLEAQAGQASFNAEMARLQLEELRGANNEELGAASTRITQAERDLERVRAGASEFDIEQAQIAVELAELQLEQAQLEFERTFLTAPFDGVVAFINVEEGQITSPGVPIVQFVNIEPLSLVAQIDEAYLQQVAIGMPARIELDALPNTIIEGTVADLAVAGINRNGLVNYEIELQLNVDDERVRMGMTAEAEIIVQQIDNILTVPNRFIQRDRTQNIFYVEILQPDGSLYTQPVSIGARSDNASEIIAGLTGGETLAFRPQTNATSLF